MINIDLSSTLFYESGPLISIIVKLLGKRNSDDLLKQIQFDHYVLNAVLKHGKFYN